jgi:secretion/DNA translocation related TadE-like protein
VKSRVARSRALKAETGIATVSAVTAIGLICVLAVALVQVGIVVVAKHRAQTAADLAALAGSAAILRGGDGCATAGRVAERNGADLARCRTDLAVVTVEAERPAELMGRFRFRAIAEARAAPDFYVSRKTRSSSRTAPALSSGSLPLPHLGDWMHDGQPVVHEHSAIRSRVIRSQLAAIS